MLSEGAETQDEVDILKKMNCGYIRGAISPGRCPKMRSFAL